MPIESNYIYSEAKAQKMGQRLMAVVAEGKHGRIYFAPEKTQETINLPSDKIKWKPQLAMPNNPRWFSPPAYGMDNYGDLFTSRQLVALNTFSDLVSEARKKVIKDAKKAGMADDGRSLADGGTGAAAYADAVATYLAFGVSRLSDICNSICRWEISKTQVRNLFTRQAIPMMWDFAENNVFANAAGDFGTSLGSIIRVIEKFQNKTQGIACQQDAQTQSLSQGKIISTDPPYYDNIGYADLSDFFYVWMRRNLREIYPGLFATMTVPKAEELVATPYRHGSKAKAEEFFLDGMTQAMHNLARQTHPAFPVTIYYAFKSSDTDDTGTGNTGWETFLAAVLKAGFAITGTWPMRTELGNRMIGMGTNALASSIVLVCRKRDVKAGQIGRREFLAELKRVIPDALRDMLGMDGVSAPIAPVDLAQAAIGPGMEIFSQYEAVLNSDGTPMTVHAAMLEINREITDYLNPESGNFDRATLFCNEWFTQYGWEQGPFGEADVLARAKGTTVAAIKESGVISSERGKVQLLAWRDYPKDYVPEKDAHRPTWEACHHLIRVLNQSGESAAGELLARMPESSENARQLAYYLYTLCERAKKADDARYYNELITSWHAIVSASLEYTGKVTSNSKQQTFF